MYHIMGDCEMYNEERDVIEEDTRKIGEWHTKLMLGWGLVRLGLVGLGCSGLCGVDEIK